MSTVEATCFVCRKRIGALASRLARALKTSERAEHVYVFGLGHHARA